MIDVKMQDSLGAIFDIVLLYVGHDDTLIESLLLICVNECSPIYDESYHFVDSTGIIIMLSSRISIKT